MLSGLLRILKTCTMLIHYLFIIHIIKTQNISIWTLVFGMSFVPHRYTVHSRVIRCPCSWGTSRTVLYIRGGVSPASYIVMKIIFGVLYSKCLAITEHYMSLLACRWVLLWICRATGNKTISSITIHNGFSLILYLLLLDIKDIAALVEMERC